MINHQFVPQDFDEDYCDVTGCDRHIDLHANIEGITNDDEQYDGIGMGLNDIVNRYVYRDDE